MLIVNTCLTDRSFPTPGAPNKSQLVALPQATFTGRTNFGNGPDSGQGSVDARGRPWLRA